MWEKIATEALQNHRGKLVGSVIGLFVSLMVLRFGLLWTAFIVLCTFVGYQVGRRVDDSKETLLEIVDRYLPPGDR